MIKRTYLCSLMLGICLIVFSQLHKYVHNIESAGGHIDSSLLVSYLRAAGTKSIYFISESLHNQRTPAGIKKMIFYELIRRSTIDYYFFEHSAADYYTLRWLDENRFSIADIARYEELVTRVPFYGKDSLRFKEFFSFFKKEDFNTGPQGPRMVPLDLGTDERSFTVLSLAYITKAKNSRRIEYIDRFCDSVAYYHEMTFYSFLFSDIDSARYYKFATSMERFRDSMMKYHPDEDTIVYAWDNLAGEFALKYFGREQYAKWKASSKTIDMGLYYNYRDSLLFSNIEKNWQAKKTGRM